MTEGDAGRSRNDQGQYSDRIPARAALEVFERQDDRARPLTATDVMESLDCSRRTAHNKLNELVDRDLLDTRKVGARGRVWWMPLTESPARPAAAPSASPMERAVEDVDLPGTGNTLEARQDALLAAYEYLREHPTAKKGDFLKDVFPSNAAGYETADGWWNAIQPALKELPGVDPPSERGHIWHFLGG